VTTPQNVNDPALSQEIDQAVRGISPEMLEQIASAPPPGQRREREGDAHQKVTGVVLDVRGPDVFVNVGGKSEGLVKLDEFPENEPPKMGQVLELVNLGPDPDSGLLRLSFSGARHATEASMLKVGDVVKGKVTGSNIGGLELRVNGIRAFLPMSQVDVVRHEDFNVFLNQWLECEVTEVNRRGKGLVLSRRRLLERSRDAEREQAWTTLAVGQQYKGIVRRLTDFGAFVDIGHGVEGLLHVSDMSYTRVDKPSDLLKEGQEVEVKILKLDRDKNRIGLGMKQLSADPWTTVEQKYSTGATLEGRVTKLMNFGAFVELEPGIEGLIPVSEMSWTQRVNHPKDVLKVGDNVRVVVLLVDPEHKKLTLSLKALSEDPWKTIADRYQPGVTVSGAVTRVTDFGAFVQLEEGVEGLVHVSELSDKRIRHATDVAKPGQVVEARVLRVDAAQRRIALSMKPAAADDPVAAADPAKPPKK
jgi:small subunit ribosomal protein S1